MLQKLSQQVRKWHECAAEAKQKAEAATDPTSKAEYLDIERHWLTLASSYAFAESLSEFQKLDERARADAGADASLSLQEISTLLIQEGNPTPYTSVSSTPPSA